MKSKGFSTLLFSAVGVVAMLVILIAFNIIAARGKQRIDLTADRAYTLSPGTRNIIAKIDTPVQIRFYCTRGENEMPVFLKTYAQRVEDLLGEFRQASKGKIEIQRLDPQPDSDAEDSARIDGIDAQSADPAGLTRIYLGLSVSMLDQKEAIPFLAPNRERLLEYDIARALSRVITTEKPVIGIMSPLPVNGQMNPMMRMGGGGSPPWTFVSELRRDFNTKTVEMTVDKIPDDIKVLVLIHPKGISETAQFAVDQFLMRGGKLIAYLDPMSPLDRTGGNPMMGGAPSTSTLDKLLPAWGVTFESQRVVADMDFVGMMRNGKAPAVLALTEKAVNKDDVLTSNSDNLFMILAGSFGGSPVAGLKQTVLVHSSENSQLVDALMAQMGGEQMIRDFKPSKVEHPLAIRLTGKFPTAFPNGKPKAEPASADPAKPEEKKDDKPAPAGPKESPETTVILIGDSDILQDQIATRAIQNPFGGQQLVMPANGNLAFAQGAIEQLSGDDNLIGIRSRASRERPFTVVKEMQFVAEQNYQSKIKDLETSLADAQRKLNELQTAKGQEAGQKFILSPEQQKEIENFRKKESDTRQQLKQERKKLRADIDSLETKIKWLNIAGMPVLVAIGGVVLALARRSKRAAR